MLQLRMFDWRGRIVVAVAGCLATLVATVVLLPVLGGAAISLLVVPAVAAGALLGRWAGLVAGAVTPLAAWALPPSESGGLAVELIAPGLGLGFGPVVLGGLGFLSGSAVDELTRRRRAEVVSRAASEVLRIVAADRPLRETLQVLTERVERLQPGSRCSLLLLDPDTRTLHHGAAPRLPAAYTEAIDGVEIGDGIGSCGTAAATGRPVIVADIRTDPLWQDFRELAAEHGLRACWSVPVRASDGRVLGTFAVYYDRPRRPRRFELEVVEEASSLAALALEREEARGRQRELEDRIRTSERLDGIEVLAGGVAHDLNNILTGVLGSADLLAADLPPASAERAHAERIRSAARQASELADRLLLYAGRHSATLEPTDLAGLARAVVEDLRPTAPDDVTIELATPAELPSVSGDAAQLRQVMTNLILNAVDAIGELRADRGRRARGQTRSPRGRILVSLTTRELAAAELSTLHLGDDVAPGPFVELSVTDDGCGIEREAQRHIFAPFYSTKRAGRGVGLASALGIVRLHGGAVSVESEPGRGSTFRIFLPVAADAPAPLHADDAPEHRERFDGEALVVEDDQTVAQVVEAYLTRLGFTSVVVDRGEVAVELVQREPDRFRVVLVDLTLPDLPGHQVKSRMEEIGTEARFVLTSGYDWETANLGADEDVAFLHKPYDLDSMRRTLQKALR